MNKLEPLSTPRAAANDRGSRNHVHDLVLIAATAVGLYLCYRLTAPFLAALAWALALAVLFAPLHRWLESKLKRPNLTATITVFLIGLAVVVVAAVVTQQLISEAAKGAVTLRSKFESGEWLRAIEANPTVAPIGRWMEKNIDFSGTAGAAASWLTTKGGALVQGSVMQGLQLVLTFYLLYFFLRDRREALGSFRSLSPLSDTETDALCTRVVDTIHATVYGTLTVAAVQGTLGGLMFWWLGLPAPLLWGVVMGLLAIVPVLGAFIVWIPAAIFLALEGSWGKSLVLAFWGSVVVGGIDNLLYPILVGTRLKMHTVLAFIAVIGGLIVFGAAGLILGPVVVAITLSLLEIWRSRNARADL
jgi:predicted PurR-regulated permease PerM